MDAPKPFATEPGFSEHVGTGFPTPVTLQTRATFPVNPFAAVIVTVAVADPPAGIEAGDSGVVEILKSGVPELELSVSVTRVLWVSKPEVPLTMTL